MTSRAALRAVTFGIVVLGLPACTDDPASTAPAPEAAPSLFAGRADPGRAVPDQYVVVLREDVEDVRGAVSRLASAPGDTVLFVYEHALKGFAARLSPASRKGLSRHPSVREVTQDEYGTVDQTIWGLDRVDQRALPLDATYAPSHDGTGVNLYVLDTGIRKSHQEFDWGARARHGYTAISDGRGSEDCNGHGTHVAATAAGTRYGVAKGATVHAVRIADCWGSPTVSALLAGLDWVAKNRVKPAVANVSFSWSARSDIDSAVQKVIDAGVTVVTSAGNNNADACGYSPNRKSNVLTVANSTGSDWRYSSSNWGSCVRIFAPGADILSAWSGSDTDTRTATGTSMSSPHVAGTAALYLQGDPSAPAWKVQDALEGSATLDRIQDARGSANRLLYAFPVYLGVSITGPTLISGSGSYTWEAFPEGGTGSYTYQWSVYYSAWGYTEHLGTGKSQSLWVDGGSGDLEIRVRVVSGSYSRTASHYVANRESDCGSMLALC